MQISHYRDYAALREAMGQAEWSTAATILHKREMCKTLQLDAIISYLKHHGIHRPAHPNALSASRTAALHAAPTSILTPAPAFLAGVAKHARRAGGHNGHSATSSRAAIQC